MTPHLFGGTHCGMLAYRITSGSCSHHLHTLLFHTHVSFNTSAFPIRSVFAFAWSVVTTKPGTHQAWTAWRRPAQTRLLPLSVFLPRGQPTKDEIPPFLEHLAEPLNACNYPPTPSSLQVQGSVVKVL